MWDGLVRIRWKKNYPLALTSKYQKEKTALSGRFFMLDGIYRFHAESAT